jgi:phosphoserine phosphatase
MKPCFEYKKFYLFFLSVILIFALSGFSKPIVTNQNQPEASDVKTTIHKTAAADPLPSWNDGLSKQAIISFVVAVTTPGSPDFVAKEERIATFDSDGTLMAEQPVYFQFLYEIYRAQTLASEHPEWHTLQPFKAALEGDLDYLAHSASQGELDLMAGTETGRSDEETRAATVAWAAASRHPRFNRPITDLVYQPMLELLNYLRANGFKTYVVTGTEIEFVRAWSEKTYGIVPEMIVGSSVKVRYQMNGNIGSVIFEPASNFICNGDDKPTAIHYMIGRRPIAAFGNSDSDIPMLQYATSGKGRRLGLLVHHTDNVREWAYDRGSRVGKLDKGFNEALGRGWVVIDIKKDWKVVFPFENIKEGSH